MLVLNASTFFCACSFLKIELNKPGFSTGIGKSLPRLVAERLVGVLEPIDCRRDVVLFDLVLDAEIDRLFY